MIEAKPIDLFSRDFGIEDGARRIALLDVAFWREAGEVSIEGRPYRLYREGLMSGDLLLESAGRPVARAAKPSAFRSRFEIELDAHHYTLQPTSLFGNGFSVLQDGAVVGTIRRAGLFTRRTLIDLPSDWSVPVQVFVFWLVLVIWNRNDSAAASSAAAAGA
jgi:hypothetical protein